ncbi:MAG: hypothetical protein JNM65_06615 [Verrucomicrobiaceae bacterium]|nr:hypothetical protein [Verrucomicrobiaceae bacterium]
MRKNVKIAKRFCCPHCLTVRVKSPGIQMLAEGADEVVRGAYHLDVIERAEHLRCQRCQGILKVKRLIAGDYDYSDWIVDGPTFAGLVLLAVLRWSFDLGWVSAIIISLGLATILWWMISRWQKRRIRARVLKP